MLSCIEETLYDLKWIKVYVFDPLPLHNRMYMMTSALTHFKTEV